MRISRAKNIGNLVGLTLWLSFSTAMCFDFGQVKGVVSDRMTGARLAGVHVEISGSERRTVSDSLGRFIFRKVDTGSFSLLLIHERYDSTLLLEVRVYPELTSEQYISLSRCDRVNGCGFLRVRATQPVIE